jgi:predicted dehydrogenase
MTDAASRLMVQESRLRLGMIGGGAFGHYAVQELTKLPGVTLVALAETRREASHALARRLGIPLLGTAEELVKLPEVDWVYVVTPPFLHREHVTAALRAGKHVLCDKPLALDLESADAMLSLAAEKGVLLVTNLMQRYGAFYEPVRSIVERRLLGTFLYGSFENYASDQGLSPEHWFWDPAKSGGIFIEHGVHFFDLVAGWLGEGRVIAAQRGVRAATGVVDQVSCTVRYPGGGLVTFYHGFTQPGVLERQALRLSFERGHLLLEDWVPTSLRVHGIVDESGLEQLRALLPGANVEVRERYSGEAAHRRIRHRDFEASALVDVSAGGKSKDERYAEALRGLFSDQVRRLREPGYAARLTEANGRASLALAVEATRLAAEQSAVL